MIVTFDHIASKHSPAIIFNLHNGKSYIESILRFDGSDSVFEQLVIEIDLSEVQWRESSVTLPIGKYSLTARTSHGPVRFMVATGVVDRLPFLFSDSITRAWVDVAVESVKLTVEPPISPEVRSAHGQFELRKRYHESDKPIEPDSYLFRTYYGESATCNALSLSEYVLKHHPSAKVYWAVKDYSVPVPAGSIPVIVNSVERYDIFATAQVYVDNVHQPDYSLKRDGQIYVQTMHGYPFKIMGHGYWSRAGFPQVRVDSFDRRAKEWDIFVSPAKYSSGLLKREFRYPGEMVEIGYPRNDIFFDVKRHSIRRDVREVLGVKPTQTAVLYAPTWRDGVSTTEFQSKRVDFVDYQEVARELGEDFVLLVRGHQMSARTNDRLGSSGNVIDVTDYPEIRDLMLASDVAVLDYSSLRFDYALTGNPMVYLVPDLQGNIEDRGWLFDYTPTTAGPQVVTHRELVSALRICDVAEAEHDSLRTQFMELEDGAATKRLYEAIQEKLHTIGEVAQ